MMNKERYTRKLDIIKESGNYRILREIEHNGFLIHADGKQTMLQAQLSGDSYEEVFFASVDK